MSPVEELQAAAKKLRELAEATAQPHHPYGDPDMELVETTAQWSAEVREYLGGDMGEYCASMHPAVARAVADWLDGVAKGYETVEDYPECPSCDTGYCQHGKVTFHLACDEPVNLCSCIEPSLTVARAYLGQGGEQR